MGSNSEQEYILMSIQTYISYGTAMLKPEVAQALNTVLQNESSLLRWTLMSDLDFCMPGIHY